MTIQAALHQFANDWYLQTALILIAADFVLGITAALRDGSFRLTYFANFARNDLVKVVAWATVYVLGAVSPHASAGIAGLNVDLSTIAAAVWIGVAASLVGSVLSSLADLGLSMPDAIAGHAPGVLSSRVGRGAGDPYVEIKPEPHR